MAKRKKRVISSKKKKADGTDEVPEDEEDVPSAKKVAASSTSFIEDESSQSFTGIGTSEISEGALGSSTHFWCNYCEFSADTKQELITHMRKHMIKCSYCTFSSLSRSEVNRHVKSEHSEEVEVESASSSTDHDMDKDPCCACVFCDFLTYSTEYLEKHTRVKHRGMLPKSVAKMISKSVSARIRQADAMFYSGFSNDSADLANIEKEKDTYKLESPSSSNTIVIDEDNNTNNSPEEKPHLKVISKLPPSEENSSSQVSSCLKLDPSEEQAEKMINELSRALTSPIPTPSEWKVKVETLYCLSCAYSNVAIDKLKCHTLSRHPTGAAVARDNSVESPFTMPDVTFFCVKEFCNHFTNTSNIYQEHLMKCVPLHESLQEEEKERLKSTLKFIMEFDKNHSLKSVPRFIDYVSSFNKIHSHEESSKMALSNKSLDNKMAPLSGNENSGSIQNSRFQDFRNVNPALQNQNRSSLNVIGNCALPNMVPLTSSHVRTSEDMAAENNATHVSVAVMNVPNSHNSLPGQTNASNAGSINTDFPTSGMGVQQATCQQTSTPQKSPFHQSSSEGANKSNFPSVSNNFSVPSSHANHDPSQFNLTPASNTMQFNSGSGPGSQVPNAIQPQMSQNQKPTFTMNGNNFNHQSVNPQLPQVVESNVMSSIGPHLNTRGNVSDISVTSSQVPFTACQNVAPPVPHNVPFNSTNQTICSQTNTPFAQPFNDPPALSQQVQQQTTTSHNNHMSTVPAAPPMANPQKMLDLLSDSYSVLMDDDLDMPASNDFDTSQSTVSEVQGTQNQHLPVVGNVLPETSFQNRAESHVQEMVPQNHGMPYSFGTGSHPSEFGTVSAPLQSTVQNSISQQAVIPNSPHGNHLSQQMAVPVNNPLGSIPSSQNFIATPILAHPNAPAPQYSNNQLANNDSTALTQPSMSGNQYPSSSSQLQFATDFSDPVNSLCQPQVSNVNTAGPLQMQSPSPIILSGHNSPASSPLVPNDPQTNVSSQVHSVNITGGGSQSTMPTFLEASNNVNQPVQGSQGHEALTVPNFLVHSSNSDNYGMDPSQVDTTAFPTQDNQADQAMQQNHSVMSSPSTPMKNHPNSVAAKNVAGNSPLSPSIYLNGQAPRHNRSDWTRADMAPRGSALPQIRQRAPAPVNYPGPRNVRQNLFPPSYYSRGRGRPRGHRVLNRFPKPATNPHDDDVIVTAVIRGPTPKQPSNNPVLRRALVGGPRLPLSRGATRGVVRHPQNVPPSSSQAKKPFDVSRHFVDLACVVNSSNEDENPSGDDIQIMGITPGQNASKGPPKVVDAKKFSFCCVHCGKDQGAKHTLKQHMKAVHNDSLLGALRNMDTGQLLFFCPQLRCEFMTYDENRLTDHLYSCYSLDKSKQLPFDLHSALKNLRSLKIRNVNSNIVADGSQNNPIDLDGKGLRDTFNNNLTDAFDEMVENTIGRSMARPVSHTQLPVNPSSNYVPPRPPMNIQSRRGRPILSNVRMPVMPQNQPRQPHMLQGSPHPQGNPRMPGYQPPSRMTMRRNFRQPLPSGAMQPMRGGHAQQMPRPAQRGRPPSMKPVAPRPTLGNEEQPILIDIDPETPETARTSQNTFTTSSSLQSMELTSMPSEMNRNPVEGNTVAPFEQNFVPPSSVPYNTSLSSSNQSNLLNASIGGEPSNNFMNPQEILSAQNPNTYQENVEIPRQALSSEIMPSEPTAEACTSVDTTEGDKSNPFVPDSESNSILSVVADEFPAAENEEEQVNAILLSKVFAKVPHMPKKLSQRLVLRFKEFAAKRGVVITPNSKVIDEFVERISYKGSNPMSKQQQQYQPTQQQQQHQPTQQQQQQYQSTQQQLQQYQPTEQQQQYQSTQQQQQYQPTQQQQTQQQLHLQHNQSLYQQQQYRHSNSPNLPSTNIEVPQGNTGPLSTESQSTIAEPIQHAYDQNYTTESSTTQYQQNQMTPSPSNPQTNVLIDQADYDAPPSQSEGNNFPNQNESIGIHNSVGNLDTVDESNDIIETKVILPERDLKFSGAFANLAKSVLNQGKKTKSPSSPSATPSPTNAAPTVGGNTIRGNSVNCISSRTPALESSLDRSNNHNPSTISLIEQVSINEKLLKREIPMAFPSTREEDSILVESSVDHLVSGYASLEVDIAGKPLMGNSIFPEELTDSGITITQAEKGESNQVDAIHEDSIAEQQQLLSNDFSMDSKITGSAEGEESDIGNGKIIKAYPTKSFKIQDPVIDKRSGKLVLKIKKGNIQRKQNDPSTNVVSKTDEAVTLETDSTEQSDEQVIRRSERKRKVRQQDVDDEVDELDELISDDDDEYQIESDDDSYDENEFKGHSNNKKRNKSTEDVNAFDVKQKGLFYCWICYKKFIRCLGLKKHILQKHSKAFCALSKEDGGESDTQIHYSLLLFCPKHCKYVTSKSDAFTQHITSCRKSGFDSEGVDFLVVQQQFVTQEYVELQELIATGAVTEMINKRKSSSAGKKKKQPKNKTPSTSSQNEDKTPSIASQNEDKTPSTASQNEDKTPSTASHEDHDFNETNNPQQLL